MERCAGGEFLNRKMILILALTFSGLILSSALLAIVYPNKGLQVPTEWHQTSLASLIIAEQWDWDWTNYQTSGPWVTGPTYALYKMVGDALFFTYPGGSVMVAYRFGDTNTWTWSGGGTGKGGPGGTTVMMSTITFSITFTYKDIPDTDDDNDYEGLRLVVEMRQDLYRFVNVGDSNYLWQGWLHQHFISWMTEGSKA